MKMEYDCQIYEVKLHRPTKKVFNAMGTKRDEEGEVVDDDVDYLGLMVKSVDGVPIDEVDDELQWAALFAAMEVFKKVAQKKSAPNGAGPR